MSDIALKVDKVNKSFGDFKALKNVEIEVKKGEVFGFLGPNGAGKTTTIRCIMDYYRADSGSIEILGRDSIADGPQIKRSLGYLSADSQLYLNWTGRQHLDYVLSVHGRKNISQQTVKRLGLNLDKKVKTLSSGNQQKLAIVLAFCAQPDILVMDEPTRGLDPLLQVELYEMIKDHARAGGTVFFSSHNLPEVQRICDRVAVINGGKVVVTKSLSELLQIKTHVVIAVTQKPLKKSDFKSKNTEVTHHSDNQISLKVRGPLKPVLDKLEKADLIDLEVTHANLEDIFRELL